MTQHSIKVQNVKCGGCANAIETGLNALAQVQHVAVDIATGTVTVSGEVEAQQLQQTLMELGYPPA
jgi:copper chaperone